MSNPRKAGHPVRMEDGTVFPTMSAFLKVHPVSRKCPGFYNGQTGDEIIKWYSEHKKNFHKQVEGSKERRKTYLKLMKQLSRMKVPDNDLYRKQKSLMEKK